VRPRVADDQASKTRVTDEYVCAEPEHEIFDANRARRRDGKCEVIGARRFVEEIGWTADTECGVLTKGLAQAKPRGIEILQEPITQLK